MKRDMRTLMLVLIVSFSMVLGAGLASAEDGKIMFGDLSWDSCEVVNRIAGFVLEHGYGYEVDYQFVGSTPAMHLALCQGDVDVLMESWSDNIVELMKEDLNEGHAVDLGTCYPDSPQGWYVPTYMIEGDEERGIEPMAPELKSVYDLKDYWELFEDREDPSKGRFYNAPSVWEVHDISLDKFEAYGLSDHFNSFTPGSQAALATAISTAYRRGDPIVAYYWEPTWLMGLLDMTLLEEPPFDSNLWGPEGSHACAFPAAKVPYPDECGNDLGRAACCFPACEFRHDA